MAVIIDRRKNGNNKSSGNREKFLKRVRGNIADTVNDIVNRRKMRDIGDSTEISIKKKSISEPVFQKDRTTGERHIVTPGNKEYTTGDRINKPNGGGQGQGRGKGSPDGEGEDDFIFTLDREEMLNYLFDGLELPGLLKKSLKDVTEWKKRRNGFTNEGMPSNLNIVRSLEKSIGRRIAMKSPIKAEILSLEEKLDKETNEEEIKKIVAQIEELRNRLESVPFIDDFDLQYNAYTKDPVPVTSAVVFYIMDVSGSMGEEEKNLAKRFFYLLYLFLTKKYNKVEIVFLRHTTVANEVDEETFFYDRESGGTIVSSALELMKEIIEERYNSSDWNIYAAQASDGDNWETDGQLTRKLLADDLLPLVRYFIYMQTIASESRYFGEPTELWNTYTSIKSDRFVMRHLHKIEDIYPVFRELFEQKEIPNV